MFAKNHILFSKDIKIKAYQIEFESVLTEFSATLSEKELHSFKTKLGLKTEKFDTKSYIQAASETTVVRYFLKKYPLNFRYEPKLQQTSKTNFDCQFSHDGNIYNVEVKTANYGVKEKIENSPGIKISTDGRYQNFSEISESLKKILSNNDIDSQSPVSVQNSKRMDNNLKDFLMKANEQFPTDYSFPHLNVLFIGCADSQDMQEFEDYLSNEGGFFTQSSYIDPKLYSKVDCVVLTNLYYNHSSVFNHQNANSWDLSKSFNLVISNPFREKQDGNLVSKFLSIIPNYTMEYQKYFNAEIRSKKLVILPLKRFIHKELGEKQRKYFF